jgi:hypothetical protein
MKKEIIILSVVMGIFILMTAVAITQLKTTVDDYDDRITELERKADLNYKFMEAQQTMNDVFANELGLD